MKSKLLIARPIFQSVIDALSEQFEVSANQEDRPWTSEAWKLALSLHDAALTTGIDPINAEVLGAKPRLKIAANMAVGFNNFDVPAMTALGVQATNTPDVLTETTADFGFALLMATARRMTESEHFLRAGHWNYGATTCLRVLRFTAVPSASLAWGALAKVSRVVVRMDLACV